MSTIKVNAIQNTSGVEVYTAKCWVNFNGTGTVAIRAAGGVSSVSDNGVGDFTLNFTNAFSDINYSCVVSSGTFGGASSAYSSGVGSLTAPTTSAVRVLIVVNGGSNAAADPAGCNVAIFR